MSGKKGSDVKIALQYSLTIGSAKTDKVKVGWWKETVDNPSQRVVQMRDNYTTLANTYKSIEETLKTIQGGDRGLGTERDNLGQTLSGLENRDVSNDEDQRQEMLDLIARAQETATALKGKVDTLSKLPVVTFAGLPSEPVSVKPDQPITLRLLGITGTVPSGLTMELRQEARTPQSGAITFDRPETRNLYIFVPDTATTARGTTQRVQVKVDLSPREITIGKAPPPAIVWGTPLTAETLAATATGPGGSVTLHLGDRRIESKDLLDVGSHTLTLKAEPTARTAWRIGEKTFSIRVDPRPRQVTCKTPIAAVKVDETLDARALGAKVWVGSGKSRVEVTDADIEVTVPPSGVFAAVGKGQAITFKAPATDTDAEAEFSTTIDVTINKPDLTWAEPPARSLDDKNQTLGPSLTAKIVPDKLKKDLVYTPAATEALTEGVTSLKVEFAATALYEAVSATARLTVFASASAANGFKAMQNGSAFKRPTSGDVKDRLDQWDNEDDPNELAKKGREMMNEMKTKTGPELIQYMRAFKDQPGVSAFQQTGNKIVVDFANGLRLRYKPGGSTGSGGKPTFCMEVMKSNQATGVPPQQNVAFKITAEGNPAAKGPSEYQRPGGMRPELETTDFINGAHASTHLVPVGA